MSTEIGRSNTETDFVLEFKWDTTELAEVLSLEKEHNRQFERLVDKIIALPHFSTLNTPEAKALITLYVLTANQRRREETENIRIDHIISGAPNPTRMKGAIDTLNHLQFIRLLTYGYHNSENGIMMCLTPLGLRVGHEISEKESLMRHQRRLHPEK